MCDVHSHTSWPPSEAAIQRNTMKFSGCRWMAGSSPAMTWIKQIRTLNVIPAKAGIQANRNTTTGAKDSNNVKAKPPPAL